MPTKAPKTTEDLLDRVSRKITVLGSIIAALVGVNAALTTCSNESVTRYQSFQQAVGAEELYWRSLYNDYLGAFRQGMSPEERNARYFALSVLAKRDVPDFHEYPLGLFADDTDRRLAHDRLQSMKDRLRDVLARAGSTDLQFATQQQDQNFADSVGSVRSEQDRAVAPAASAAAPPPPATAVGVSYVTQVLAAGDPHGWDFDIFWCGGGGTVTETQNYAAGYGAAHVLADLSASNGRLGDQKLGRVRLVMLPQARQGDNIPLGHLLVSYPTRGSGNQIRPEGSAAEQAVALQVRRVIPGGGQYVSLPSTTPTPYYISLFACAAREPAAQPAATAAAPAA
jgi:hypothetical protein